MATQPIKQTQLADQPVVDIFKANTKTAEDDVFADGATQLAATGVGNGFSIPAENLKLIALQNQTSTDATITLKAQTPPQSILRRYFDQVVTDYSFTLAAGKTAYVKPHVLITGDDGNIIIEATQRVWVLATPEFYLD